MSHMTVRAFERTRGRDQNFTKTKNKHFFRFISLAMLKMCLFFFLILYAPDCVPISNALSGRDTQRAKFKQVRRFTEKLKKHVYAVHSSVWRHSVQNKNFNLKNEQWRVFLCKFRRLEIFCRHVGFMWKLGVDPWSKRYGFGVTCLDETSNHLRILSLGILA